MSEQLERIVKMASQKVITDEAQIADIMGWFLGSRFLNLAPKDTISTGFLGLIRRELTEVFKLDDKFFKNCSVGAALMMISREKNIDFFSVPYVKNSDLTVKIRQDAGHCYYLAVILHLNNKNNVRLKQLMRVDFDSFIAFLKTAVRAERSLDNISEITYGQQTRMLQRLNNECKSFVRKCYRITDSNSYISFTLGDLLERVYKEGNKPWFCNAIDLYKHANETINAYRIAEILFGDMVTNILVVPNKEHYSITFNSCLEGSGPEPDNQPDITK